ncbi:hypothetical protein O4159_01985 [Gordonia terrae]|uniref:hypothetical protein n=1 Tax=Gordonia hongkongensis TaxID=1701090 RepID=UPI0022B48199|nr:hypothetical protein [Gordonia terrae]
MPTTTQTTTTRSRPTDDEIETAILSALADLGASDGEMVRWSRVRALLPRCGFWQAHAAQDRLWRRGDLVVVQMHGSPLIGLADECSRMADAAREERGEPRQALAV